MNVFRSALAVAVPLSFSIACSSTTNTPAAGGTGVVTGAIDAHCGAKTQSVASASCHATATSADAGLEAGYGDTMYNAEGDDDDCKYHVKWTATPVSKGANVSFTVTLATKSDAKPATGSPVRIEAFLDDTHPAPNSAQSAKETSAGTYDVGPISFDASGRWTVRFHMHEECTDVKADSPHGHAAFFVQVP